jgi:hypothetical protein
VVTVPGSFLAPAHLIQLLSLGVEEAEVEKYLSAPS